MTYDEKWFPSPYGVWVVSVKYWDSKLYQLQFPSPCGVGVVS